MSTYKDLVLEFDFDANSSGGRWGYPVFWASANEDPSHKITLPIQCQSDPDMLWDLTYEFGAVNGAAYGSYNALEVSMGIKVRASVLAEIYPDLYLTNILGTPSGSSSYYKIDNMNSSHNATNCFWSYTSYARGFGKYDFNLNLTENLKQSDNDDRYRLLELYAQEYDWDYHVNLLKTWKPAIFTDENIEKLRKNSCIYYHSYLPNGITNVANGYANPQSLWGRSGAGNGWYPGCGWIGLFRTWGRTLPQHLYYKNNSYANGYQSPSLCVTNLQMRVNREGPFESLPLGTCVTGLPPEDLTQTQYITDFLMKANPSVYIRRSNRKTQTVFTNLNMTGNLTIPSATSDKSMANLKDLDTHLNDSIIKGFFTNANYIQ